MDKWAFKELTKKVNEFKNQIAQSEFLIEKAKESIKIQQSKIKLLKKDLKPFEDELEAELKAREEALEEE